MWQATGVFGDQYAIDPSAVLTIAISPKKQLGKWSMKSAQVVAEGGIPIWLWLQSDDADGLYAAVTAAQADTFSSTGSGTGTGTTTTKL